MAIVGALVALTGTGAFASGSSVADRMSFYYYSTLESDQLPLTATSASSAGWDGTVRCILGRGRFFQKSQGADDPYPVMPIYGSEGRLVGIQMHSRAEQPSPWVYAKDGLASTEVENLGFPHWRMGIYLVRPVKACGIKARGVCPTCYG